jgi:CHAT domain-containing protein
MRVATFTVVHIATRQTLSSGIGQDASVISYAHAIGTGLERHAEGMSKSTQYRKHNMTFARMCAATAHMRQTLLRGSRVATFTIVHVATRRTLTSGIGQDAGVISYTHAMV